MEGVNTVVVATVDGFDVASALRTGEAARVAAMASSISAISAVVSQEARLGRNKSVTMRSGIIDFNFFYAMLGFQKPRMIFKKISREQLRL